MHPRGPARGQLGTKGVGLSSGQSSHCLGVGPPGPASCGEKVSIQPPIPARASRSPREARTPSATHWERPASGPSGFKLRHRPRSKTPAQLEQPHCDAHAQLLPSGPRPQSTPSGGWGGRRSRRPRPVIPAALGPPTSKREQLGHHRLPGEHLRGHLRQNPGWEGPCMAAEPRGSPAPPCPGLGSLSRLRRAAEGGWDGPGSPRRHTLPGKVRPSLSLPDP